MAMSRIELFTRVGPDGVLRLKIPVGPGSVDTEYRVVVEPLTEPAGSAAPAPEGEPWADFVHRTAGSIPDPSFRRHEQGELQERDPL